MKAFVLKGLLFISPLFVLLVFLLYLDVFKIFHSYDSYYKDNFVALNREMICTKTFNKYKDREKFNSFIFGSSRSQAFKCKEWHKYLAKNAVPFHFDASGEGLVGIFNKIQYINEVGVSIKNALLVIDRDVINNSLKRVGHLYVAAPCLSNEYLNFYRAFFKAHMNIKFWIAYFDYSFFKRYRDYMGHLIMKFEYPLKSNDINCDMWYGSDEHIKKDFDGYYQKRIEDGVFYDRSKVEQKQVECPSTEEEIMQLNVIQNIFKQHNTNYKIIVSPLYDQIPLEREQVMLLKEIFGAENVYDFSGKNKFTESIYNYYETSHFRPNVADEILEIIYTK